MNAKNSFESTRPKYEWNYISNDGESNCFFSKLFQKYLVKSGTSGEKTKRAKRLHKLRQHNYIKTLQNNCSKKEKTLHNHIKLTKHCRSAVANVQRIVKGCRKQSCPLVSGGWFGDGGFPDFKAYSYSRCRYLSS